MSSPWLTRIDCVRQAHAFKICGRSFLLEVLDISLTGHTIIESPRWQGCSSSSGSKRPQDPCAPEIAAEIQLLSHSHLHCSVSERRKFVSMLCVRELDQANTLPRPGAVSVRPGRRLLCCPSSFAIASLVETIKAKPIEATSTMLSRSGQSGGLVWFGFFLSPFWDC